MEENLSQPELVRKYIRQNGSITSLEAIQHLGITRLAAIILQLKKQGHDIKSMTVKAQNRFGKPCSVSKYYFPREIPEIDAEKARKLFRKKEDRQKSLF